MVVLCYLKESRCAADLFKTAVPNTWNPICKMSISRLLLPCLSVSTWWCVWHRLVIHFAGPSHREMMLVSTASILLCILLCIMLFFPPPRPIVTAWWNCMEKPHYYSLCGVWKFLVCSMRYLMLQFNSLATWRVNVFPSISPVILNQSGWEKGDEKVNCFRLLRCSRSLPPSLGQSVCLKCLYG